MGRNATSVVAVPLIRGVLRSYTASIIAFFRLYHSFCLSEAHSITTIIVSIATQRVSTREKFVRKFSESHKISSTIKVTKNARGRMIDAMIDSLNHTKINIVRKTSINVCNAVFARFL